MDKLAGAEIKVHNGAVEESKDEDDDEERDDPFLRAKYNRLLDLNREQDKTIQF